PQHQVFATDLEFQRSADAIAELLGIVRMHWDDHPFSDGQKGHCDIFAREKLSGKKISDVFFRNFAQLVMFHSFLRKKIDRINKIYHRDIESWQSCQSCQITTWNVIPNPTNGSWWIVQVQPRNSSLFSIIPPTAVGGYFKSDLRNVEGWT